MILHIEFQRIPRADPACRAVDRRSFNPACTTCGRRFGFMETPDISEALRGLRRQGLDVFPSRTRTFFLGWHLVRARPRPGHRGHQVAHLRLPAAAQRTGRGVLPHADARRRRAGNGDRHLAWCGVRADALRYAHSRFRFSTRNRHAAIHCARFEDKPNMGELRDKLSEVALRVPRSRQRSRARAGLDARGAERQAARRPVDHRGEGRGRSARHLQGRSVLDQRHARHVRINRWQKAFPDRKVLV